MVSRIKREKSAGGRIAAFTECLSSRCDETCERPSGQGCKKQAPHRWGACFIGLMCYESLITLAACMPLGPSTTSKVTA